MMPAYNAAPAIGAAIDSVLAQGFSDLELIVVDDGSEDDTATEARSRARDPRMQVVRTPNRGQSAARNEGQKRARGRFIAFFDADDLMLPQYLGSMVETLERERDAGFAYTDAWVLDDRSGRFQRASAMAAMNPPRDAPRDSAQFLACLVERNFVYGETTVRREVLDRVGWFDPSLRSSEDYDLWIRIAASGVIGVPVPGRLAVYRRTGTNASRHLSKMYESESEVLRRVADDYVVPEPIRKIARHRRAALGRSVAGLTATNRRAVGRRRAREIASRVRARLTHRTAWLAAPPVEVAAAFPTLFGPDRPHP